VTRTAVLLLLLSATPAFAAPYDGMWECKPMPTAEIWDAQGKPQRIYPDRFQIEGDVIRHYIQVDGKYVEDRSGYRVMRAGDYALLYIPYTGNGSTLGLMLKQKNADVLSAHYVEPDENDEPMGRVITELPDCVRIK